MSSTETLGPDIVLLLWIYYGKMVGFLALMMISTLNACTVNEDGPMRFYPSCPHDRK